MNFLDNSLAPNDTDYVQINKENKLTTSEQQATHVFKKRLDFNIDSTSDVGELVFSVPLDNTINQEVLSQYELYELEDVKLQIQSASPMGTSSGSIQVCHITDPENVGLPDSKALALAKIIRQSNSMNVRPRDSTTMEVDTPGPLFTLQAGTPRLWAFGSLVAVVRTKPEVGDNINFQVTLTGMIRASRTAVNKSIESPARSRHTITRAFAKNVEPDRCTLEVTTNSNAPFSGSDIYLDATILHCESTSRKTSNKLMHTVELRKGRILSRYYDDTTTTIQLVFHFPEETTKLFQINKVVPIMIKPFATVL